MNFYYLLRRLFYILIYLFYLIIINVGGNFNIYCPPDYVIVLNKIIDRTIQFGCHEAKFCQTSKYAKDCIYNDGRFSCIGENTFTSSLYQRPSDDLILHKCCTFWHQTKEMQRKLKLNLEEMNCFDYEFNFNNKTGFLELYTDTFNNNNNNNFDPLKIEKYFTNYDVLNDFTDNNEIIFVKKIQPKRNGYFLMLCKNECIKEDVNYKNQSLLNNFLSPSHYNVNGKDILSIKLKNQKKENINLHLKLGSDQKKKYKFLKTKSKEFKSGEWEDISQSVKVATFKKMINDLEKNFNQIKNGTKNVKLKNRISIFKVNSTKIILPPFNFLYQTDNRKPDSLFLLFEKERKLQNIKNKLSINGSIKSFSKPKIKQSQITILPNTTPSSENFFYFQTRQNGLKIKIIPEKSDEINPITTPTTPIPQNPQQNDDETLTIENLPIDVLMKIIQEHKGKQNNNPATTTTTTTPEPNDKKLKDEVLNLQKQLLLVLLKDKEENKSKESVLSLISKETLIKLLSGNEQKMTTTTTPEPTTTKQRVVLEFPKEILQLLLSANKNSKPDGSGRENNNSNEKEKNDEKISLSAVTLLKLLTANIKNQSKERKNKSDEEDKITTKNIPTTTLTTQKKVYKSMSIVRSDGGDSNEDVNENYSDEVEKTTKTIFSRRSRVKTTTKKSFSVDYEDESDEETKIKLTTQSKFKKRSTHTSRKKVTHNEDSDEYYDNKETTKHIRSTKKLNKTAAAVTILTSSESDELTTISTTKSTRKSKQRSRHSTTTHHKKNKKRINRRKSLIESLNTSQFLINLIPRLKETFGIEPQIHPTERKLNITPSRHNTTLEKLMASRSIGEIIKIVGQSISIYVDDISIWDLRYILYTSIWKMEIEDELLELNMTLEEFIDLLESKNIIVNVKNRCNWRKMTFRFNPTEENIHLFYQLSDTVEGIHDDYVLEKNLPEGYGNDLGVDEGSKSNGPLNGTTNKKEDDSKETDPIINIKGKTCFYGKEFEAENLFLPISGDNIAAEVDKKTYEYQASKEIQEQNESIMADLLTRKKVKGNLEIPLEAHFDSFNLSDNNENFDPINRNKKSSKNILLTGASDSVCKKAVDEEIKFDGECCSPIKRVVKRNTSKEDKEMIEKYFNTTMNGGDSSQPNDLNKKPSSESVPTTSANKKNDNENGFVEKHSILNELIPMQSFEEEVPEKRSLDKKEPGEERYCRDIIIEEYRRTKEKLVNYKNYCFAVKKVPMTKREIERIRMIEKDLFGGK
uniref:Histone domain-containing protein n=1 Tax=Strongyloides stercoralis TaxID=6248 RepID=A0AAF5HXX2_STRER